MRNSPFDLATQVWVRLTGRRITLEEQPWLDGPVGDADLIGERFFHRWAERQGLSLDAESPVRALLPALELLGGDDFTPESINPRVASFYRETSRYSFAVVPEWRGGLRLMAWVISFLFSRRLRQLNVPLSLEEARSGGSSEVFPVTRNGRHLFSAWVRALKATNNVLYAGAYSIARVPGWRSPCVKVVFPLPNGNAIVILRPELLMDGSLLLCSEGRCFGDPGFYFFVQTGHGRGVARYVRALQERIHVFPGAGEEVRAKHEAAFLGLRFLSQHYRMQRSPPTT